MIALEGVSSGKALQTPLASSRQSTVSGTKIPPVRYDVQIPTSNQCRWGDTGRATTRRTFSLPVGGLSRLLVRAQDFSPHQQAGIIMVAALLWESRKARGKDGHILMQLVKAASRRFLDKLPDGKTNAATFVAEAWECAQESKGCNFNGKKANRWFLPKWSSRESEKATIALSASQIRRWDQRKTILQNCSDQSTPAAKPVREALKAVTLTPQFYSAGKRLPKAGQRDAAEKYLNAPHQYSITRNGDILSNFSRLPEELRGLVTLASLPAVELDIQSAHPHLLGQFYADETSPEWRSEFDWFKAESVRGFPSFYGEGEERKKGKRQFLAALNQSDRVAGHSSEGYKCLENDFPLLAGKIRQMKAGAFKALGDFLRSTLAGIMAKAVLANSADGVLTIPVTDSIVVGVSSEVRQGFREVFRSAWRLAAPITAKTGTAPLIEASDGTTFQFHL